MPELFVRVWDIETRRMGVPSAILLQNGQPCALYVDWRKGCVPIYTLEGTAMYFLMYGTGINDQHGQRIYGSDIIKEYAADGYTLNEVKFGVNDSEYGWYVDYIQSFSYDDEPVRGRFSRYLSLLDVAEKSEVVGNIYEHAHLMRKEHGL